MLLSIKEGVQDFSSSISNWRLWTLLGWLEIRQRYARSSLGPFWLTLSMGVFVATLALVYGALFKQPLATYLPLISSGLVLWGLLSAIVNEGSSAFISSASYIRQIRTPKFIYIFQVVWRNIIISMHNFLIVVIVLFLFNQSVNVIWFFAGLIFLILNAFWLATLVAIISARFRDFPQIVSSIFQVLFYVTPIIYSSSMLTQERMWVVKLNPFAYLMDIVRLPLMGATIPSEYWTFVMTTTFFGWLVAFYMVGRYKNNIPFWI